MDPKIGSSMFNTWALKSIHLAYNIYISFVIIASNVPTIILLFLLHHFFFWGGGYLCLGIQMLFIQIDWYFMSKINKNVVLFFFFHTETRKYFSTILIDWCVSLVPRFTRNHAECFFLRLHGDDAIRWVNRKSLRPPQGALHRDSH